MALRVEPPESWRWCLVRTMRTLLPEVVLPKGAFAFCYFLKLKMKSTVALVADRYPVDADFLAVTLHVVAAFVFNQLPVNLQ